MSLSELNITEQPSSVLIIPTLNLINTAINRPQPEKISRKKTDNVMFKFDQCPKNISN
jgi:hypothetical protein